MFSFPISFLQCQHISCFGVCVYISIYIYIYIYIHIYIIESFVYIKYKFVIEHFFS